MKKLLIVNNNMQLGGIQKALISLLHEIKDRYDVTLFLFSPNGACLSEIPEGIKVVTAKSLYCCFGISQAEAKEIGGLLFLWRTVMAILTRFFGRSVAVFLANLSQPKLKYQYDVAISYLQSGDPKNFYGGCNEFVLSRVNAAKKVTFLHGDYGRCGANHPKINRLYRKFDLVAACSVGCGKNFVSALPDMADRCIAVPNCHNFSQIIDLSKDDTVVYDRQYIHAIIVARLSQEKGVERGLAAVKYALDRAVDVKLHIVGDGFLMDSLKKLSRELGIEQNVVFYGAQTNPYRYIKNADILLIPSYHEAAPLVIDEAICLGVPVFSAETTSSEDMITNRNCGWVCENDQASINAKFFEILSEPDEIASKKRAIAQHGFCDNATALQMVEKMVNG